MGALIDGAKIAMWAWPKIKKMHDLLSGSAEVQHPSNEAFSALPPPSHGGACWNTCGGSEEETCYDRARYLIDNNHRGVQAAVSQVNEQCGTQCHCSLDDVTRRDSSYWGAAVTAAKTAKWAWPQIKKIHDQLSAGATESSLPPPPGGHSGHGGACWDKCRCCGVPEEQTCYDRARYLIDKDHMDVQAAVSQINEQCGTQCHCSLDDVTSRDSSIFGALIGGAKLAMWAYPKVKDLFSGSAEPELSGSAEEPGSEEPELIAGSSHYLGFR